MVEKLVDWFTKLDTVSSTIIGVVLLVFAFIILIMLLRVVLEFAKTATPSQKQGFIKKMVGLLIGWVTGKKKDDKKEEENKEASQPNITVNVINNDIQPNTNVVDAVTRGQIPDRRKNPRQTLEVSKTIESSEVIMVITKVIKYKDKEKDIEKDFMMTSMKTVETVMNSGFDGIIKEMFFQSNPDYYKNNMEEFKMLSSSVSRDFVDLFRTIIINNHLERYTENAKRKEYINEKIIALINNLNEKMSSVVFKLAQKENKGEFLSYLQTSVFAEKIHELFEELLLKLIDYAITRENAKDELKDELTESFSTSSTGLSQSSIDIIKDILDIN